MNRLLVFLLIVTPGVSLLAEDPVIGNGKIDTETRKLDTFDRIEFRIAGDFDVAIGKMSPLKIKADENVLPLIKTEVRDGRLIVSAKRPFKVKQGAKFSVTVSNLEALKIVGAADVKVHGLDNKKLTVELEGAADIKLSGETGNLTVNITGAGDVSAFDLSAREVSVSISGSGDAQVNAAQSLSVSITGNGDVTYTGKPNVSKAIAGNGDVHRRR